jgi:hypothetical protein
MAQGLREGRAGVEMKRLALLACVWLSACGDSTTSSSDQTVGSGVVVTESRPVSGFTSVSVSGVGEVILDNTGTESLTITAEDNILPLLESEVRNGVLILGPRPNSNLSPTRDIDYRVSYRELTSVLASGVTVVNATGVDAGSFTSTASGVSLIRLSGTADRQTITISGTSTFDAAALTTRLTSVGISGASNVVVNASERLEGNVSGTSTLEYIGNPVIDVNVSGTASVRPR